MPNIMGSTAFVPCGRPKHLQQRRSLTYKCSYKNSNCLPYQGFNRTIYSIFYNWATDLCYFVFSRIKNPVPIYQINKFVHKSGGVFLIQELHEIKLFKLQ